MFASNVDARLAELSAALDDWLRAALDRWGPRADRFKAMLAYPLGWTDERLQRLATAAPAGKRLRPGLVMLGCESICGDPLRALPAAAAVELVHNFSLVHDDIQDRGDLRRGRPTVWVTWGEAQAINVGDSLFALAELAILSESSLEPGRVLEAARALNSACMRLVEGQFLDLDLQGSGRSGFAAYELMIAGKTGALIKCCARLGAIFGGAGPELVERFAALGRALGAAFQYQDDELGMWGDPAEIGKSVDSDLRTRKQALPAVLALDAHGPAADRFRELFDRPGELSDQEAAEARRYLEELGIRPRVAEMVRARYREALDRLAEMGPDVETGLLTALIEQMAARRS